MNLLKISDQHTIFEASAGTGKTYHSSGGFALNRNRRYSPLQSRSFDFYRKSEHSELEDRIRSEMISPKNDFNLSEEEFSKYQKRIQSKVKDLPRATIGTIHSFCRVILRKYAFRIGFSNQFLEARESRKMSTNAFIIFLKNMKEKIRNS